MSDLHTNRGPAGVIGVAWLIVAAPLFWTAPGPNSHVGSAPFEAPRGLSLVHRPSQQEEVRLLLPAALNQVGQSAIPGVTPLPPTPGHGDATSTPTPGPSGTVTVVATATATGTDSPPTSTATATAAPPTPTATATLAVQCTNLLRNGDFELGPQAWDLTVTGQRQASSKAIQQRSRVPVPPHGGEWLAWLGGANEAFYDLASSGLTAYEPSDVVSATLGFHVAIITEEVSNRRPNDEARFMVEGDRRNLRVEGTGVSEENFRTQRTWQAESVDVTELLATDTARRLHLEVETDSSARTWFYFDDLVLIACVAPEGP